MSIYHELLNIKRENKQYLSSDLEEVLSVVHQYNTKALKNNEKIIRCTELLAFKNLGSPATIHKNYCQLVKRGFLSSKATGDDKRVKYITLTALGLNYFAGIDKILLTMLTNSQKKLKKVLTM